MYTTDSYSAPPPPPVKPQPAPTTDAPAQAAPTAAPAKPNTDSTDSANVTNGTSALANSAAGEMGDLPFDRGSTPNAPATITTSTSTVHDGDATTRAEDEGDLSMGRIKHFQLEAQQTQDAYNKLPADEKKQYDAIKAAASQSDQQACDTQGKQGVSDGPDVLDRMLRNGKFDGAQGKQLLGALNQLATQKMAPSLQGKTSNGRMVSEALLQIQPGNANMIQQNHQKMTCGEASLERKMALNDPAGYVQTIADLASADRPATLPGGEKVTIDPNAIDGNSNQSTISAIFQNSLHGEFTQDHNSPLSKNEFGAEYQALFGGDGKSAIAMFGADQQSKAYDALQPGDVAVIDGEPGSNVKHAVTVVDKGTNADGQAYVSFTDPEGKLVTTSAADFQAHLRGATLPASAGVQDQPADWQVGGFPGMAQGGYGGGPSYGAAPSFRPPWYA